MQTSTANSEVSSDEKSLRETLETALIRAYGAVISIEDLWRLMGLKSLAALRQAHYRGHAPIPLFSIPRRRGKFGLASDLARWLVELRSAAGVKLEDEQQPGT